MILKIAIFGESEKGRFTNPYFLKSLPSLLDTLGTPPKESEGIYFAIQFILYGYESIFFRVSEEGFSVEEYLKGFWFLKRDVKKIHALAIPGVGNKKIIEETKEVCDLHGSLLVITEKDLYDYLTMTTFEL